MRKMRLAGFLPKSTIPFVFGATFAASAWSAMPEVNIANGPFFNGRGNVHPNMLLSLSVEFPTAGIAYRGDNGTYNRTNEYPGYFNPLKCYVYNGGNRNLSDTGDLSRDGYFHISKDADPDTHECGGDSFSGNFMNWAASSAIDMLRYALTGGDRIYDRPDGTVLQRAVLKEDFYAHGTYFPRRVVTQGGNVSAPRQVTPFDVTTLYVVSCRNRILFSDASSGTVPAAEAARYCAAVFDGRTNDRAETRDKRLGEFLARVRVCDSAEGATRTDLCERYGIHYKPVGAIQRNSERLRLGAMGYLLDDAETRYGGVLRAPMKYVGPIKLEAPGFVGVRNDKPEWDPQTGVFYNNPENPENRDSLQSNSGVINYLNKFGRSGIYKRFDPVGELYYEGIRYLQGKSPTPDATSAMTEGMKDGFPVITEWADPILASCQKNFIVAIADVNTHWDRYIPGNDRTRFNTTEDARDPQREADAAVPGKTPALDVKRWTRRVGEMEVDSSGAYKNPARNANLSDLDNRDTGSARHGTYYMAGLAYWANTQDIRLDKPTRIKTFAIDVDEGGNGLIDGNHRPLKPRDSQLYLAAKYGGFDDRNNDGNPFITLSAGGTTIVGGTNTEWDNGHGVPANYFLAGQPRDMIASIRKVFDAVAADSGTISGVSTSSAKISSDGAYVYQPGFNSSRWSGSLRKLGLSLDRNGDVRIANAAVWDAGEVLTGTERVGPNPLPEDRKIYTFALDRATGASTVEFKWLNLDEAQQTLLSLSPGEAKSDDLGAKRLEYLRGDRSLEQGREDGIFRTRDRVLADIVNSTPVYVGPPASNVQGPGYQKFYDEHKARAKAVYVGANGGMLHAFGADDGRELFAYAPNALIKDLNQLTSPDYVHRPYVDGAMVATEARIRGSWKTVLASGMGGGAQGVFALDVTDPANFGGGLGALWEFTDNDDPDIGNVAGAPVIAKFRVAARDGYEHRYFVAVSSGLNNYKDDGRKIDGSNKFNSDGAGVLFLLSLDKRPSDPWVQGTNYFKFRTGSTVPDLQNGLSPPALVVDVQGAVRYAYAGDLQGNLWRFDFTEEATWPTLLKGEHKRLFTATDAEGSRQPITTQPKVVFAPGGGYVILFGTGKYVEDPDAAKGNFRTQSFYGIYDPTNKEYSVAGRGDLTVRTLVTAEASTGGGALKITGDNFSYSSTAGQGKGWHFDFLNSAETGERSVTNPLVADGILFFNSLIPNEDPCASGGGRTYMLDTLTGLPVASEMVTAHLSTVGMLSAPLRLETGMKAGDRNAIGRRTALRQRAVVNFGTGGAQGAAAPATDGKGESVLPAGRLSWRELINWQELRNVLNAKK